MIKALIGIVFVLIALAIITNPFSRITIIKPTYKARFRNGKLFVRNNNQEIRVRSDIFSKLFGYIKSGLYILETRYVFSRGSKSESVKGIIADIHWLRFNPRKLLLISGDHFNSLFVRNLGVFYYPMLDTAIPSTKIDWEHRQIVYLQTLAFALGTFAKADTLTTTIVPVGKNAVSCINFYAYPSDTLYGILYSLAAALGQETARPFNYAAPQLTLQTTQEAEKFLATYKTSLRFHYDKYRATAYDESTGLVSTSVHMSGAKDITRRRSAFYDNVVFWKTTDLAMKLGLLEMDVKFLKGLKQRILDSFWLKKEGYFLEDLSEEGVQNKFYSSDWLAVLFMNFLDPARSTEQHYFTRSLHYIDRMAIARPMAVKYQHETRASRQFLAVRLAVASYGGDAIWSFWGMEYIKLHLRLYELTKDKKYLTEADYQIEAYDEAIRKNRGFPEVYDPAGKLLKTPLYQSIRMTGWVIGYEQVLAMRKSIKG